MRSTTRSILHVSPRRLLPHDFHDLLSSILTGSCSYFVTTTHTRTHTANWVSPRPAKCQPLPLRHPRGTGRKARAMDAHPKRPQRWRPRSGLIARHPGPFYRLLAHHSPKGRRRHRGQPPPEDRPVHRLAVRHRRGLPAPPLLHPPVHPQPSAPERALPGRARDHPHLRLHRRLLQGRRDDRRALASRQGPGRRAPRHAVRRLCVHERTLHGETQRRTDRPC